MPPVLPRHPVSTTSAHRGGGILLVEMDVLDLNTPNVKARRDNGFEQIREQACIFSQGALISLKIRLIAALPLGFSPLRG
jgi:hypothetical protein